MTNWKHLGDVIAAREEYTDEELAQKCYKNMKQAHTKTIIPLECVSVIGKNVEEYSKLLTLKPCE